MKTMNLFKTLSPAVLAVALITQPALAGQKQVQNPIIKKGGVGGGGGDFIPGTKVTPAQVTQEVNGLKPYLKPMFQSIEILFSMVSEKPDWMQPQQFLLFEQKPNVYDRINNLSIKVQNEPCPSQYGKTKGASVYNSKENEFCLSTKEATEALTTDNLFNQLLAISAHELLHKMQIQDHKTVTAQDEESAYQLQLNLLANMTLNAKAKYSQAIKALLNHTSYLYQTTVDMLKVLDNNQTPDLCRQIRGLDDSFNLMQTAMLDSVSLWLTPLSKQNYIRIMAIGARSAFTDSYCPTIDNTNKPTQTFKASEIYKNVASPIIREIEGPIIMVGTRDAKALRSSIQMIHDDAKLIIEALKQAQ